MVRNAGIPSVGSLKSISVAAPSIKNPTIIRAGAVAAGGISKNTGENKRAIKKNTPVVRAVRPVFPPAATPEELSTKLVTVEVPNMAPKIVPTASANKACFTRGMVPFLPVRPARSATPTSVPTVSKISTKRNEKKTVKN